MRSVFLASLLALFCVGPAFAGLGFWDDEFTVAGSPSQKAITGQAVAPFRDSRQVVVWTSFGTSGDGSGQSIRAQMLAPDGSPIGADFQVNTTTAGDQSGAVVTALKDGRFAVVWSSADTGDGAGSCVRARVFKDDGAPEAYNGSTDDFIVNTDVSGDQFGPVVGAMKDGGFLVAFSSNAAANGEWQVKGRLYGSSAPIGAEFMFNSAIGSARFARSIAMLKDGGFVVGWFDVFPARTFPGQEANNNVARVFNSDGTPRTGEFLPATTPSANPSSSGLEELHIAPLDDGGFVTAWRYPIAQNGDGSDSSVRGRIFNGDGSIRPVGLSLADFQINSTTPGVQAVPHVVGRARGAFLAIFSSPEIGGEAGNRVLVRQFRGSGRPDGADLPIKLGAGFGAGSNGVQAPNAVAALPDGRILTLYTQDFGPTVAIQGRFLDFSETQLAVVGGARNETFIGTSGADSIDGGGGNDKIYAGGGVDELFGGPGRDLIRGNGGSDTIDGGPGRDTLFGGGGKDRFRIADLDAIDEIGDFSVEDVELVMIFSAVAPGAATGTPIQTRFVAGPSPVPDRPRTFLYDTLSGLLSYDADGPGGVAPTPLVLISNRPALTRHNIEVY